MDRVELKEIVKKLLSEMFIDTKIDNKKINSTNIENIEKKIINYLLTDKGGVEMAEEKTDTKRMEAIEKKFVEITEANELKLKTLGESHKADLAAVKKELEETYKTQVTTQKNELEKTVKRLEENEITLALREVELHKEKVDKIGTKLLSEGIYPCLIKRAKRIMLKDTGDTFGTIKLTDDDKAKSISLSEAIVDLLNSIPVEGRVQLSELTDVTGVPKSNETKFMSVKEVKEYAKKEGIEYEDACSILFEEGRLDS